MQTASENDIAAFLRQHPSWQIENGKLSREFRFQDFVSAFAFMAEVAWVAERNNHHPEWFNVYSKVLVQLTTHEAGGITERDFALARAMEDAASVSSGSTD